MQPGNRLPVVDGAERGRHLAHFPERAPRAVGQERHGNPADVQIERDLGNLPGARVQVAQHHGRAECRMSGKGDLPVGCEDPHAHAMLAFGRGVAREDEGGFAEEGLARDRQHLRVAQSVRIEEDVERIALQGLLGEDIDVRERVPPARL